LAFDTNIHDVVAADGACVNNDIPAPQGHSVPLLDLEAAVGKRINKG
jgi:hypothetical protein